jgi:aspartate aminotransferase-like enzyme
MKIFPDCPSDATTAFLPPPGISPAKVQTLMEERFGVLISGGQGELKGKILRIGHLGYFDFLETLGMIACLELSLVEAGATIELGIGSRAAVDYYRQAIGA